MCTKETNLKKNTSRKWLIKTRTVSHWRVRTQIGISWKRDFGTQTQLGTKSPSLLVKKKGEQFQRKKNKSYIGR